MNERAAEELEAGGSGSTALAGYEYQIDVSAWLALDLVLAHKLTTQIILEPVSQEDLEAELNDQEIGPVISKVALDDYRLIVQAKLRNGDSWTPKTLAALLKHGGTKRKSASEQLSDPKARYLLITSASLNGAARQLEVLNAGVWPTVPMPHPVAKVLPKDADGRVAVICTKTIRLLNFEVQRLLTERFRVPNARWRQCWQALREDARARVLGAGNGRWSRTDLERVIREHEGYLASSPELDRYVYPSQWQNLVAAMSKGYAAIIVGQSGTGKTMATQKLYEVLRAQIPGLSRVHVTHGPHQITNDQTPRPVLYDIEDPWGRFDFDSNSRPWNDQLARLFAGATADRLIVATSRLDVAKASGALPSVRPWMVPLEAEHYGASQRHLLFVSRIEALPRALQAIAIRAEKIVLEHLATPLEIQKFFDALTTLDRSDAHHERAFVEIAIRQAHQESIERTVIEQIAQRDDVRAATVMWALLKANGKLSLRGIRGIEDELADVDVQLADSITPLIDFFVAARNLRQSEDVVTFYHPRVEAGIEKSLSLHPAVVSKVLRQLVDVLTASQGAWGSGVAARIVEKSARLELFKRGPSHKAQVKIDAWLEANVPASSKDFEFHLRLTAAAGSSASDFAELARRLLPRRENSAGWAAVAFWRPTLPNAEWTARIKNSPVTQTLLDRFIRELLPSLDAHYSADFAKFLHSLAPGLTDTFLDVARRIVGYGVMPGYEAIAAGALANLGAFESIVDEAVDVLTPTDAEWEKAKAQRLSIINGEYSDHYVEYLQDNEEGYTAGEFVKAYVRHVRKMGDWRRLAEHRHCDHLVAEWIRSIEDITTGTLPDAAELEAVFQAALKHGYEEQFWQLLQQRWSPVFLPSLLDRLRAGTLELEVRRTALACLIENAHMELSTLVASLPADAHQSHGVMIAIDLGALLARGSRHDRKEKKFSEYINSAIDALPLPLSEIAKASVDLSQKLVATLSHVALALLADVVDGDVSLHRFRVDMDQHISLAVEPDITWLLTHADNKDDVVAAVDAAARHSLTQELRTALDHRFANASAHALTALAMPLPAPLPALILDKVDAKGSPIRNALVAVLDAKPHTDHLSTLLKLVGDKWSQNESGYGEDSEYPIARSAAKAIAKLGVMPSDIAMQLHDIALVTNDRILRTTLFNLIAEVADADERERLFKLAITPGRTGIQRDCANALLCSQKDLPEASAARITPEMLATSDAPVAATLALLLSAFGDPAVVLSIARTLAAEDSRLALLLLLAWPMVSRDEGVARQIAALLPQGHAGVAQIFGTHAEPLDADALNDLGDVLITAEVFFYIGDKPS